MNAPSSTASTGGITELASVDPVPFLEDAPPDTARAWLVPRRASLAMSVGSDFTEGSPTDAAEPLQVIVVERAGAVVRVAAHLERLRFVAWIPREDLLSVLARDVSANDAFIRPPVGAKLHRDAVVQVLERDAERARVRYSGGVEVTTWVPLSALADRSEGGAARRARPQQGPLFPVAPGMAIRAEPRWGGSLLAVVSRSRFLQDVRAVDDAWHEVRYGDGAVTIHGFASRRFPPVPLARRATSGSPAAMPSDETLPAGTCLYADVRGELVGRVIAELPATGDGEEEDGWRGVFVDTPWGPLRFAARRALGEWAPCP
ncbi:MAG: hypothetical protein R3B48_13635 [Kofleriaceae bacterium]